MKKNKIVFLSVILCLLFSFATFGEWIKSEKLNKWLWRDKETNTIPVNTYFWAEDGDVEKMYHAGQYGFIDTNKQIDADTRVNENGEVVKNSEILTRKKENKSKVINNEQVETETTKKTIDDDKSVVASSEDSSNILYAQNTGQGRLLKNYILSSQNVEILTEKSINGSKKNNVICFKQNGSFISIDTKKYNKIIIKAERDKSNKDNYYELKLVVNGEEEDSISFDDEQYEIEQEFMYGLNDDVDIVLETDATSSSWSSKGLYITSGRMSKYKEDDEE